jgi:hypothetical protein
MASKMADIQRQLERTSGRAPDALKGSDAPRRTPSEAPSREGKIHIGAYLHPDFKTSLRLVQARTGKDIQGLLADALNELFRFYNVPVVEKS